MLTLETLERRDQPATLDVSGGALVYEGDEQNNNLTVQVGAGASAGYAFNDTASTITLGAGALAAGWRGNGTNTVTGLASTVTSIEIDPGAGTNTVNLRSLAAPTTVNGGSGTTSVNLSSTAPTNNGNLNGIAADVTVNAGDDTRLWVADVTATGGHSDVRIGSSGITGLGAHAINYSGTFTSLRVSGSAASFLAETFTVEGTLDALYFRLDCNGGNDTVFVSADVTGDFYLGTGDDVLTVLAGVTLTGDVHTGAGSNVVNYGAPAYGTITGSVGA